MTTNEQIELAMANTIEHTLEAALSASLTEDAPPLLAQAMRYAVFPGGARIRPRLSLAVACACGQDDPAVACAAASAIELMHCASLVHDDLPCFDNAATRRGKASVHRAFSERLAVLAGDALIVLAFESLARGAVSKPARLATLVGILARSVGTPLGICAGQAWESEPMVSLSRYQQAKTGALFAAATMAGAAAAGHRPEDWRMLGERLGEAYQVADDIRDVAGSEKDLGKPIGQDVALGRPSAARELGIEGAIARLDYLINAALASIPPCPGANELRALIQQEADGLLPVGLQRRAA
ncbi:MAG: polyprenyl synthetase family protein [Burkholderiales bacterium]